MKRSCFACLFVTAFVFTHSVSALPHQQKLTNKDVIKMVKASLPADVIIQAIKSSMPDFDVSADGLIALKQEGVPDSVIQAMLARSAPPEAQPPKSLAGDLSEADLITGIAFIDGENRMEMRRASPSGGRTGGVGMKLVNPFGKIKMLQTFNGNHAQLRTINASPVFEVSLPGDLNPADSIVIVRFTVKSDRREISIARGRVGMSAGISKDDMLSVSIDELPTKNITGFQHKIYRVNLVKPVPQGEYALVVQGATYYDFGVDISK